ncbi:hypothetical protein [Aureimonas sp. N4]|uniref:hypothetical protein n=1 Tax=Aureimonas sp. N4 TaxID=1638165 RepID=UPI000B0FB825|nr:hypothetical protein [Aureimonas sp. N4]
MKTTLRFFSRTGRRLRSYVDRLIKPLLKCGRLTIKLTLSVPLLATVEIGAEWSSRESR